MTLSAFLEKVRTNQPVSFAETMAIISDNYHYQPTVFSNGALTSPAGTNEGSCKIFAFALLHQLSVTQTLALFAEYYDEVLNDPDGLGHQNIRHFRQTGWQALHFMDNPLTSK